MSVYIYIYIYIYIERERCVYSMVCMNKLVCFTKSVMALSKFYREVLQAKPKRGLVKLRFIIFLDFPSIKRCLLVWDSGLQLVCGN